MGTFYFFSEKAGVKIIIFLGIIALGFQYSDINYYVCSKFEYELKYPLGRICEMFPYASIGFCMAYYNIFELLKKRKGKIILGSILLLGFIASMLDSLKNLGFGYSGMSKIGASVLIVVIFFLLPMDKLSDTVNQYIILISKYTLGIYCMHFLVGKILVYFLGEVNIMPGSLGITILIYLFCITISYSLDKMPFGFLKKLVK